MMFLNSRLPDVECYDDDPKRRYHQYARNSSPVHSSNLQKVTLVLLSIYLFLSICIALFHLPISLISLSLPILVLLVTTCAVLNKRTEDTLWFCAIASTFGAVIKIMSIVFFSSIFGFSRSDPDSRKRGLLSDETATSRPLKTGTGDSRDQWLMQFFIVLLMAEAIVLIIVACIRCNWGALRKCFNCD